MFFEPSLKTQEAMCLHKAMVGWLSDNEIALTEELKKEYFNLNNSEGVKTPSNTLWLNSSIKKAQCFNELPDI